MALRRRVQLDALAESAHRHLDGAIICVDVLLCSTTAVTSVAQGRRTLIVASAEEAYEAAGFLRNPVLADEMPGRTLLGFEAEAGPAVLDKRRDIGRPLVLTSPTAHLLANARGADGVYLACLRNAAATAAYVALHHERVTVIGAGHGPDTRCEDQIVATMIAQDLIRRGFEAEGLGTMRELSRWRHADVSAARLGRGAELLNRIGQREDVEFALGRRDDLDQVCEYQDGEVFARGWHASGAEAV
jgi:phosphosulfolactate phosphohydrolase-like enzyme